MMWWLLCAFAVSAASITLAKSAALVPYRRAMKWIGLGNLARCHFCTSHWLSIALAALYRPVVGGLWWIDLIVAWLALVGMSALLSGLIMYFTEFNSEE